MKREFKWVATFVRNVKEGKVITKSHVLSARRFVRLETAVPRMIQLLMLNAEPGDVVEIASSDFGFVVMNITAHVGGSFTIQPVLGD